MISAAKTKVFAYWTQWAKARVDIKNPQTIHSRNIYILPSKFGWVYALLVITLLTGAINYQISTIFLMTFLLAMIGLVSAWEGYANLKNLSIKLIALEDAQQYTAAKLTLLIQPPQKSHFSFNFQIDKQAKVRLEKIPIEGAQLYLPLATTNRGYYSLPRLVISSQFPLGLFTVWSYVYFHEHYFVYPQPVDPGFFPTPTAYDGFRNQFKPGDEELYDLKSVENPWSAPNKIAWRIAAKGQGWYHKVLGNPEKEHWLFRLQDLPGKDLESQLQHLSYWLHVAEANGAVYALDLRKEPVFFAQGNTHLKHLLRQLAVYI